jgi:hypothetical protein
MEKLSYENILTNITLHQIDSTSLHLLFQRNFTLLNDNYGLIIGHFTKRGIRVK